jgi:hypothetical protein
MTKTKEKAAFKPEIVRMLYAMWQGSPWLFKMTP